MRQDEDDRNRALRLVLKSRTGHNTLDLKALRDVIEGHSDIFQQLVLEFMLDSKLQDDLLAVVDIFVTCHHVQRPQT